jgi:hypothetical protein
MNLPLSMAVVAALAVAARAQNAPLNTAPTGKPRQELEVAAPLTRKTNDLNTNILSNAQGPKSPKETSVTYGGLVTHVRKSTNHWRMFSLRRPANLKEDDVNLIHDLRTEAGGAVKVFSVDF